ncbi:hypothetical protein RMSM_01112 [Rhodopirellula maiorica SM1]|uniref:Uncharacterized protein n=1 Tax=Rhodopirellula maiorica SM1 TaxID=1265738 RepID=M5S702_9BACT|nr:hypothetical protein RMSM_01112 [Rhodopirellula maiorica SM1]
MRIAFRLSQQVASGKARNIHKDSFLALRSSRRLRTDLAQFPYETKAKRKKKQFSAAQP